VAFAFLAVMAFSAVPSPLYGLYRERDHFSLFMITVIYAVYAVGVIGSLLLGGHLSDWYGRAGGCYYRRWVSRSSVRSSL
jgi:MFS family permease